MLSRSVNPQVGQTPSQIRLRSCMCCRERHRGTTCLRENSRDAYVHRSSRNNHAEVAVNPTPTHFRKRHISLEQYDTNDYYTLRNDGGNVRPRRQEVTRATGDGNSYLHIQRKIASLLYLLEENQKEFPQHTRRFEDNERTLRDQLVGTTELRMRNRPRHSSTHGLPSHRTEGRRRWFDHVLDSSNIGTVELDDDTHWSFKAHELRGAPGGSHRRDFDVTMKTIYKRMLREHPQ
eukprot:m.103550 g.103550  ORF g.103550 m.103550 type:complete len:234 (-) comp27506_c1_seq1:190-891(-)